MSKNKKYCELNASEKIKFRKANASVCLLHGSVVCMCSNWPNKWKKKKARLVCCMCCSWQQSIGQSVLKVKEGNNKWRQMKNGINTVFPSLPFLALFTHYIIPLPYYFFFCFHFNPNLFNLSLSPFLFLSTPHFFLATMFGCSENLCEIEAENLQLAAGTFKLALTSFILFLALFHVVVFVLRVCLWICDYYLFLRRESWNSWYGCGFIRICLLRYAICSVS